MQRKFLTNLALLLSLNLLVKPFWILGIDRTVQNMVGPEEYGFYFAVFNFSFLFNILLDLGITNYNNRNIAQHHQLLNKHFSGILSLKFSLAVIYFFITLGIALVMGYDGRQINLLLVLAFNQFLVSMVLYLRSNISGLMMFRTDSLISIMDRSLMIIFCAVLIWGHLFDGEFRIEWFVYAQTLAYIITAITALAIVISKSGFRKMSWNLPFSLMIIRKSFPFAILVLLMTFYNRIDSVMLERILPDGTGDRQAGIYASAFRLLDAANMVAYLFAVLLLPIFSRMLRFKENIEGMVRLSFSMLIMISVSVAIGSSFYSYQLMDLFYIDHVLESSNVFHIIMLGFIAISTTYIFGTLLTANGNLKTLNIIAATGMVLNIGLNLILIPRYQAVGSAYASLITQFTMAVLQVIMAVRIFRFKLNIPYLLALGSYFIIVTLLYKYASLLPIPWMLQLIAAFAISMVLGFALKLLRLRRLFYLLFRSNSA